MTTHSPAVERIAMNVKGLSMTPTDANYLCTLIQSRASLPEPPPNWIAGLMAQGKRRNRLASLLRG